MIRIIFTFLKNYLFRFKKKGILVEAVVHQMEIMKVDNTNRYSGLIAILSLKPCERHEP